MTEFEKIASVLYTACNAIQQHIYVADTSFDCDNDSCEIIFTLKDGKTYVVKATEDI